MGFGGGGCVAGEFMASFVVAIFPSDLLSPPAQPDGLAAAAGKALRAGNVQRDWTVIDGMKSGKTVMEGLGGWKTGS